MILDQHGREQGSLPAVLFLLDAAGREIIPEPIPVPQPKKDFPRPESCDIVRSFSYKLSLKDDKGQKTYESADFFCSLRSQAPQEIRTEVSRELDEFCMDEVMESIKIFNKRRADKRAKQGKLWL